MAFCADSAFRGDAQDAKLRAVLVVLAWICRAGIEEDLPVDPSDRLVVGVAKDDHIGIRIILGEMVMVALKTVAISQGEVFVEQVMPH